MADSNEPANGTGSDLQPDPPAPAPDDQPQSTPDKPVQPVDLPDKPSAPAEATPPPPPEAVETPETPEVPEAPEAPETPETPEAPEAPEVAEAPEAVEASEAPKAPAQPVAKSQAAQSPKATPRGRSPRPGTSRRRPGKAPRGPSIVARYGLMGHLGEFRHNLQPPPGRGTNVVARTERGVELAEVVTIVAQEPADGCITPERLEEHIKSNGPDYPFRRDGKLLRLANPQDLIDQRHLNSSATDERIFCAQGIKDLKLAMKLVAAEHLLGGERIIFYFLSEHRVDFRALVQQLAEQYHTRIEMRQVGARDEARLVGDYERCGQECCCKQFLKGLQPVSMRMAKTQKATLDPSKISGRCGRLMCCLRYEDQCYRDLKKCLPHKNIWVKTCDQIGRVTGTQILTQLVQVQLPNGSRGVFANEDIVERNVDAPPPPTPIAPRTTRGNRGNKPQGPAAGRPQTKPKAAKQTRQPKPPPAPAPAPPAAAEPAPLPKATAEALDPGWAGLLGDSIVETSDQPTSPPSQDSQAPATTDEPPASTPPQAQPPQATAEQNAEDPSKTDPQRKKRRRRRGRRAKRKPSS
jgi:cell fate regulator YaaT (PSP1 superfamily)